MTGDHEDPRRASAPARRHVPRLPDLVVAAHAYPCWQVEWATSRRARSVTARFLGLGAVTTHGPVLPIWSCGGCAAPWPCPTRRRELRAEFDGAPVSLALYLGAQLVRAAEDLTWLPRPRATGASWDGCGDRAAARRREVPLQRRVAPQRRATGGATGANRLTLPASAPRISARRWPREDPAAISGSGWRACSAVAQRGERGAPGHDLVERGVEGVAAGTGSA